MPEATTLCRVAARLTEAGDLPPAGTSFAVVELTRWLQRNRIPLLALSLGAPIWLADDPAFQSELSAERDVYAIQHQEYERVRAAWLEADISCLMIKSAGNFPSFPHTSDNLDLLVRPEQGWAARTVLRQLGYVEVRNVEEPHKFLFRRFRAGRPVLAVHVHEHVGWMVGFLDDEALWARQRPAEDDRSVNVPSPEDALMINLAHAFYENKLLRLNDVVRARYALKSATDRFDWDYVRRVAAARGWSDGLAYIVLLYAEIERALFGSTLVPCVCQTEFERKLRRLDLAGGRLQRLRTGPPVDLPLDLSFVLCKIFYYRKILADPRRTIRERWIDVGTTLLDGVKQKSRIRPQAGRVVALCGPDGSGKTAHAQALVDALRCCEVKTDYVWSRGGSTGLLWLASSARRRFTKETAEGSPPNHLDQRRRRLVNPLLRFGWAWLVGLDQFATYLARAHLPALAGRVVVCDRYVYDTAVEMAASLPEDATFSRRAIAAMLKLTPRPHVGYVLDVSPEAARARRPNEPWSLADEMEGTRYREVAKAYGLRTLPNEGPFADSSDVLVHDVISRYMDVFETWLNALFIANPSQRNGKDAVWARGDAL